MCCDRVAVRLSDTSREFCGSGRTDRAVFWHRRFPRLTPRCVVSKFGCLHRLCETLQVTLVVTGGLDFLESWPAVPLSHGLYGQDADMLR